MQGGGDSWFPGMRNIVGDGGLQGSNKRTVVSNIWDLLTLPKRNLSRAVPGGS